MFLQVILESPGHRNYDKLALTYPRDIFVPLMKTPQKADR